MVGDSRELLFRWDKIPGDDGASLIEFLKQNFDIDLGTTIKIERTPDNNALRIFNANNFISLRLNEFARELREKWEAFNGEPKL